MDERSLDSLKHAPPPLSSIGTMRQWGGLKYCSWGASKNIRAVKNKYIYGAIFVEEPTSLRVGGGEKIQANKRESRCQHQHQHQNPDGLTRRVGLKEKAGNPDTGKNGSHCGKESFGGGGTLSFVSSHQRTGMADFWIRANMIGGLLL